MNWRLWRIGLVVAIATGAATALVTLGVVNSVTWSQLLLLLAVNIAKDALLFLKDHPVESIDDLKLAAAVAKSAVVAAQKVEDATTQTK
jgi:hypothetical protein